MSHLHQFPWMPTCMCYMLTLFFIKIEFINKNALVCVLILKQQNSAADLSMLVLEVLEKSKGKVEDEILGG